MQHVNVCMFTNGKFKNIVADENVAEPLGPNSHLNRTFELRPVRTPTKNWIAVEGALFNSTAAEIAGNWCEQHSRLAPSSPPELKTSEERNVFTIYVSYYVKVKLTLGGMGGEVSLKLPFLLGQVDGGGGGGVTSGGEEEEGESVDGRKVFAKGPRVTGECEVISELCEMSLSNNNVSTVGAVAVAKAESANQRTCGGDGERGDSNNIPTSGGRGSNGTLTNRRRRSSGNRSRSPSSCSDDEDEIENPLRRNKSERNAGGGSGANNNNEDDDDEVVPIISVATTVQVHVSNSGGGGGEAESPSA